MYLSKLTLNPRSRAVRLDLASAYELHRTVMRAFPDKADGGPGRVLFRLEQQKESRPPVVLVQSEKQPHWPAVEEEPHYLFDVASKTFNPKLQEGRRLGFRLRANPTVKREKKRHGLFRDEDQRAWLARKGQAGGFDPIDFTIREARTVFSRSGEAARSNRQTHFAATFEGILQVTDSAAFLNALAAGIGPAKGFGFG
ncbi:MAG: type I-E CRISPR-associated protein Cas6/Cse3/CasE, partial [Planctomycetes bacterium]|nr:type I-E CRISPR-associated protein Cas6/Cse3/CasE [Planctomycetota bacterium]